MIPFIKWAGGKRWLTEHKDFVVPDFSGKYIEPFLGGGAMFFYIQPEYSLLSDINPRLIETYQEIAKAPENVTEKLRRYHQLHSLDFYYKERATQRRTSATRAAQFLYLNRTCWNGLYRENLKGEFNVPIGTKRLVFSEDEDLSAISNVLRKADIICQDFEKTIESAQAGDFVFLDPPYTTAHNMNGFVKYNQTIFSWCDQERLRDAAFRAKRRGAIVIATNADHSSIEKLYGEAEEITVVNRSSVISGTNAGRKTTTELLIRV